MTYHWRHIFRQLKVHPLHQFFDIFNLRTCRSEAVKLPAQTFHLYFCAVLFPHCIVSWHVGSRGKHPCYDLGLKVEKREGRDMVWYSNKGKSWVFNVKNVLMQIVNHVTLLCHK